jgi:hypothetical protein
MILTFFMASVLLSAISRFVSKMSESGTYQTSQMDAELSAVGRRADIVVPFPVARNGAADACSANGRLFP